VREAEREGREGKWTDRVEMVDGMGGIDWVERV